jgi:hypothetical protein
VERRSKAVLAVVLGGFAIACQRSVDRPRPPPTSLAPASVILFPRAFVGNAEVGRAAATEACFEAVYEAAPAPGEAWFAHKQGESRVLIVAGHATSQLRDGKVKRADGGTGALALALHELAGATALYTTRQSPLDPNYYDTSEFKAALARLIEHTKPVLVLDLHASSADKSYDVDFGTMGGASIAGHGEDLRRLGAALRAHGLEVLSQDYFAASKNQTVTKFVATRGVPAIQLEINSTWFLPPSSSQDDPVMQRHRFAQLVGALVTFVCATSPTSACQATIHGRGESAPAPPISCAEVFATGDSSAAPPVRH